GALPWRDLRRSDGGPRMSLPRDLAPAQRADVLRQAIEKRLPLVASIWHDRWLLLRSRFLPCDPVGDLLCIEPPTRETSNDSAAPPVEIPPGAHIGITFRRGHHKCLFSTTVVG